jgi:hypothetical protein
VGGDNRHVVFGQKFCKSKGKLPPPHFITVRPRTSVINMHQISPFYIMKAFNAVAGKVDNAFWLENGILPI